MNKRMIFRSILGIAALSLTLVTASVWAQGQRSGEGGGQGDDVERQERPRRQMQDGEGRGGQNRPMLCPDCRKEMRGMMQKARSEDGKMDREKMKQVREQWMSKGEKQGKGKTDGEKPTCSHCGKEMPSPPTREIKCPECGANINVPIGPRFRDGDSEDGQKKRPRLHERKNDNGDDDSRRRLRDSDDRRPRRGQGNDNDDDDNNDE